VAPNERHTNLNSATALGLDAGLARLLGDRVVLGHLSVALTGLGRDCIEANYGRTRQTHRNTSKESQGKAVRLQTFAAGRMYHGRWLIGTWGGRVSQAPDIGAALQKHLAGALRLHPKNV